VNRSPVGSNGVSKNISYYFNGVSKSAVTLFEQKIIGVYKNLVLLFINGVSKSPVTVFEQKDPLILFYKRCPRKNRCYFFTTSPCVPHAAWALRAVLDPLDARFSQFISTPTYFVVDDG